MAVGQSVTLLTVTGHVTEIPFRANQVHNADETFRFRAWGTAVVEGVSHCALVEIAEDSPAGVADLTVYAQRDRHWEFTGGVLESGKKIFHGEVLLNTAGRSGVNG